MEFFQLEKSRQQDILNQFKKALYRAIIAVNKDFSQFISFNRYSPAELRSEEKGKITGLLDRAISKRFIQKFNQIGKKTKITIVPLLGADGHGKDYIIQINHEYSSEIIKLNVEQKINNQQKGIWTGHYHIDKCNLFFLIEIGSISFKKGITKLWAGIFDISSASSSWTKIYQKNSGFSNLRLEINDIENLQVLWGRVITKSKRNKRKYIKPIYSKI